MSLLLEVKNLFASYNRSYVLENINLEVYTNDFIGIIGPNGGGKTTLIKIIVGQLNAVKGEVNYFGQVSNNLNIGYLPQVREIDKKFPISVLDVVLSGLMGKLKNQSRFDRKDKTIARDLLSTLGVNELWKTPVGELSGGQAQRVFLGRALISSPELLILDEPDTFVDSNFENELYQLLKEVNKKTAVIIVTHDIGTIVSYVRNIACVNKTLHYHPSNEITNELLQSYNCPIDLVTHGTVPHRVLHKH